MDGLRDHLARFRDTFLSSDHSHMSVNDMWVSFKSEVIAAIERFMPTKMTKTKYSLPWIDSSIRRLIRKREKLYFRARKSSSPNVKNHYKRFRAHVQKVIRDAYWKHISNILSFETESPDSGSPRKNSLKNDAFGINTLRENGILKTDTLDKANICNRQFQSAFTRESDAEIPRGRFLVNCVAMREQRTAKLTLNSVSDILKLIPLFTVSSQKVTFSNVVN